MGTSLFYFNRRGAVCALRKNMDMTNLNHDPSVVYRSVSSLQARYFLVMKHIDMDLMLVALVFGAKRKEPSVSVLTVSVTGSTS